MGMAGVLLVYTRQSRSDFLADGGARGPSLDQQLDSVLRLPALQGLTVERFSDANLSGKETSKRPGYLAMMERMRTAPPGEIRAVAFYDADRLHRNAQAFYEFMNECEKRHVAVFDASGPILNDDELSWGIKAVVASAERKKIARRVKDNLQFLKRSGRVLGHLPIGYRREAGKIVVAEDALPAVRQVFASYATGRFSFKTLARYLNEQGTVVPKNPDQPRDRRVWSHGFLKDMLRNVTYIGKVRVGDELRDGTHPAIIDEATFSKCRSVMTLNIRRKTKYLHHRNAYSLGGLLRCRRCGGTMQAKRMPRKNETPEMGRIYYVCKNRREGRGCDLPYVLSHTVEEALRRDLDYSVSKGFGHDAGWLARLEAGLRKAPDPRKELRTRLVALDKQVSNIKAGLQVGIFTVEEAVERTAKVNLEKQEIRKQIEAEPEIDMASGSAKLGDLLAAWDHADPAQRGHLLGSVFTMLIVDRVEKSPTNGVSLMVECVPQSAWRRYFYRLFTDLQTGESVGMYGHGEYKRLGGVSTAQSSSDVQNASVGVPTARRESRG